MCLRLGDTRALGKPDGEEEMGSQGIAVLSDLGVRPPGSSEAHAGVVGEPSHTGTVEGLHVLSQPADSHCF